MDAQAPAFPLGPAPLEIGMLLYPGMTLLDLAGPQAALGMHGRTHLFWKTLDPVTTDGGIALLPTAAFADAPARLDVLFVPGGFGTVEAMKDKEIIAFLAERGPGARIRHLRLLRLAAARHGGAARRLPRRDALGVLRCFGGAWRPARPRARRG